MLHKGIFNQNDFSVNICIFSANIKYNTTGTGIDIDFKIT